MAVSVYWHPSKHGMLMLADELDNAGLPAKYGEDLRGHADNHNCQTINACSAITAAVQAVNLVYEPNITLTAFVYKYYE